MTKSEEHLELIEASVDDGNYITFDQVEAMNFETLKDVKEEAMLKSMYIEYRGVVIYMEELDKILEKLRLPKKGL